MLIKARTIFSAVNGYTLRPSDDITVARGVTVMAGTAGGNWDGIVYADSRAPVVNIAGEVFASRYGLSLKSTAAMGSAADLGLVTLSSTGRISSYDDTILVDSMRLRLVNAGAIYSSGYDAIDMVNHEGNSLIVNRGQMFAMGDVIATSGAATKLGRITVLNTGVMSGGSAIEDNSASPLIQWVVRNTGVMFGSVTLGDRNDLIDTSRGRMNDDISLRGGNDRFLPGVGAEDVNGGLGTDILDFSTGGRVSVYLGAKAQSTGRARGDDYADFEIILGSNSGSDRLIDARVALTDDDFRGLRGNDTIDGGFGNDRITGGLGADLLTGGMGTDKFIFGSARDGGDRITDFITQLDRIDVSGAGFGLARAFRGGVLDEALFHSGTSNRAAERDDRFIFRTGDSTLWFDRDGSGRAAPVLIADLQAGGVITDADIYVI